MATTSWTSLEGRQFRIDVNTTTSSALSSSANPAVIHFTTNGDIVLNGEKFGRLTDLSSYPTTSTVNGWLSAKANVADVYTKSQVYTKGETDSLLARKADISAVYTQSQVEAIVDRKANADNVYSKEAIDLKLGAKADTSALNAKANAADVYTKSQSYKRSEIDRLLSNKVNASDVYFNATIDEMLARKQNAGKYVTDIFYSEGTTILSVLFSNGTYSLIKAPKEILIDARIERYPKGPVLSLKRADSTRLELSFKDCKCDSSQDGLMTRDMYKRLYDNTPTKTEFNSAIQKIEAIESRVRSLEREHGITIIQ